MFRKILFIIMFVLFLGLPIQTYADETIKDTFDIKIINPSQQNAESIYIREAEGTASGTASDQSAISPVLLFIRDVIDFLIAVVGAVSLLIFIAGGLLLIVAEGQDDKIQKGKQAMVFSLIGLVVALMAYVITTAVQAIFF